MTDFVELVLRCKSWQQAQDVCDYLLSKQLIARAEVMTAKEINLLMATADEHVAQIKAEIKALLHRDEIHLHQIPLARFNHYTISGLTRTTISGVR